MLTMAASLGPLEDEAPPNNQSLKFILIIGYICSEAKQEPFLASILDIIVYICYLLKI